MTDAERPSHAPISSAEGFETIARATCPALLVRARRLVGDHAAAEDLVQETLLRAWRGRDRFRGEAAPSTWLHQILNNVARDRHRRGDHEQPVEDVEALWRDDTYTVDADAVLERVAHGDALRDALIHLPYTYRAAVVLHDIDGLTAAEVAHACEVGLPLAKARIRRGRMALVTRMAADSPVRNDSSMRCWQARSLVSDYLDGDVSGQQRAALEAHLAGCPTCPPLYTSLVGVTQRLGELRDANDVIAPSVVDRIIARVGDDAVAPSNSAESPDV